MKMYVVQNQEGKFFRSIGYGGRGGNWVDELEKAKFYVKIGQAKGRVTFFSHNYPQFGIPNILEFTLDMAEAKVINLEEETKKKIKKIEEKKIRVKIRQRDNQRERLLREKEALEKRLQQFA